MLHRAKHIAVYSRTMKARRNLDLQLLACLDAPIWACSVTRAAERMGMRRPAARGRFTLATTDLSGHPDFSARNAAGQRRAQHRSHRSRGGVRGVECRYCSCLMVNRGAQ